MSAAPWPTRALDVLEALVEAVRQVGPGADEIDFDFGEVAAIVHDASVVLYEAGRLMP